VGILIAVVAVLLLGALVFNLVTKDSKTAVEQTRPVTVQGTPLPRYEGATAGGEDPGIGGTGPTLNGEDFDGNSITIGGASDKPRLVIFVAHWCPHCQREVPLIVDWRADGTIPSDIEVIGVSTGVDPAYPNYPPSEWLSEVGWTDPVMADAAEGTAAQAYGLASYPYFVALDKDGKVVARSSGELDQTAIAQLVQKLQQG
jgi:thiol-disulfide isomerase/thioredoxin